MIDYLPTDVCGPWKDVNSNNIFQTVYQQFKFLQWEQIYFVLNVQDITRISIPKNYKNILISFHTEFYQYDKLINFFNSHADCDFLLISDGDANGNIWPDHVTYCSWVTWHQQLSMVVDRYGYNQEKRSPTKRLSALSRRNEFGRAAIVAYLINEYDLTDCIVSWHNIDYGISPWYFDASANVPDRIWQYLSSEKFSQLTNLFADGPLVLPNLPVINGNWKKTAYLDAVLNLTNESVYGTLFNQGKCYTTPYLTEKTWKPLIARQPFLPIGQGNTLTHLSKLGMNFDYGFSLDYDQCKHDFDRMIKIYDLLEHIKNIDSDSLLNNSQPSADHNLEIIINGEFSKKCQEHNDANFDLVTEWVSNHR
jgi:hypothetical protein